MSPDVSHVRNLIELSQKSLRITVTRSKLFVKAREIKQLSYKSHVP